MPAKQTIKTVTVIRSRTKKTSTSVRNQTKQKRCSKCGRFM